MNPVARAARRPFFGMSVRTLTACLLATLLANPAQPSEDTARRVTAEGVQQIVGDAVSHELSVDLNNDGTNDRLIGTTDCGSAGCTYFCFVTLSSTEYAFAGSIFLHRLGFEVLQTQHNGLSDILSYSRISAAEGSLVRYEFNGEEYVATSSVTGSSGLFDLLRPSIDR